MKKQILVALSLLAGVGVQAQSGRETVYVGTYSIRGSDGIYVFTFDRKTGTMTPVQSVKNEKSPSFLAVHPTGRYLYSADEAAETGTVSAYRIDTGTGKLTFLNKQSSLGGSPCYVSIDKTGKTAFIANYGGGNMAVLPIQDDGTLAAASDTVQDSGSGPNKQRQERPHVHSATISPDNQYVYIADLGTDRLSIVKPNVKTGKVAPASTPFVTVKPGSGPRHLAIHPSGRYAYLVEELTSSVAVFSRDPKTGALTMIQDGVATLPTSFTGSNTSADIHLDASGKFLYQSNRGYNALAIFAVGNDGKLTRVGEQPTEGKTPRNFLIDPKGEFVFVANQDTDTITIFRRNAKTGLLTYTGNSVKVPAPVCVIMGQ